MGKKKQQENDTYEHNRPATTGRADNFIISYYNRSFYFLWSFIVVLFPIFT